MKNNRFFAINKLGNYWFKDPKFKDQFLALKEDGTLLVVTDLKDYGYTVKSLNDFTKTDVPPTKKQLTYSMVKCSWCSGYGKVHEIVDHDYEGNSVYDYDMCNNCNGSGLELEKFLVGSVAKEFMNKLEENSELTLSDDSIHAVLIGKKEIYVAFESIEENEHHITTFTLNEDMVSGGYEGAPDSDYETKEASIEALKKMKPK